MLFLLTCTQVSAAPVFPWCRRPVGSCCFRRVGPSFRLALPLCPLSLNAFFVIMCDCNDAIMYRAAAVKYIGIVHIYTEVTPAQQDWPTEVKTLEVTDKSFWLAFCNYLCILSLTITFNTNKKLHLTTFLTRWVNKHPYGYCRVKGSP